MKVAPTKQSPSGTQKMVNMPSEKEEPKPQDDDDDNLIACIEYVCEAIILAVESLSGKDEEKQMDPEVSDVAMKAPIKDQEITETDTIKRVSPMEERADLSQQVGNEVPATPKAAERTDKNKKTLAKKQQQKQKSSKRKSSKKAKAMFRRFFKNSKTKSSLVDNTSTERPHSQPASILELELDLDSGSLTEFAAPQQEATRNQLLNTPTPKKVSFAPLPKRAPPSPTAVASDTFFDFLDAIVCLESENKQLANEAKFSAARIVPLPDFDSDSDVEHDASEVKSVDETKETGSFGVVKDMNEVISELNDMWQEADHDLVRVISTHISFDEENDEEPLESDYVLARYKQIVETEENLISFQPQSQMIAVV